MCNIHIDIVRHNIVNIDIEQGFVVSLFYTLCLFFWGREFIKEKVIDIDLFRFIISARCDKKIKFINDRLIFFGDRICLILRCSLDDVFCRCFDIGIDKTLCFCIVFCLDL